MKFYIPPEKRQQIIDDLKLFGIIVIIKKLNIFLLSLSLSLSFSFSLSFSLHHCLLLNSNIILRIIIEFPKTINLLDIISDYKGLPSSVTMKWIEVYHQSEKNYNVNKEIRFKTSMLRSDLCDFSDAYIVVKGNITITNPDNAKNKIK